MVKVAARRAFVPAAPVAWSTPAELSWPPPGWNLRIAQPRATALATKYSIAGVDIDGARIVQARTFSLAHVGKRMPLVGIDIGFRSLLRRLGQPLARPAPTQRRIIDWGASKSFGPRPGAGRRYTRAGASWKACARRGWRPAGGLGRRERPTVELVARTRPRTRSKRSTRRLASCWRRPTPPRGRSGPDGSRRGRGRAAGRGSGRSGRAGGRSWASGSGGPARAGARVRADSAGGR